MVDGLAGVSYLDRQALLERMGWQFYRIRGSDFYRDPDAATRLLVARLNEFGIELLGQANDGPAGGTHHWDELLERVKRRAAELLVEWLESSRIGAEAWPAPPVPRTDESGDPPSDSGRSFVARADSWPPGVPASAVDKVRQQQPLVLEPAQRPEPKARPSMTKQSLPPGRPEVHALAKPDQDVDLAEVKSAGAVVQYFRPRGHRTEDMRPKGGALWVYGSRSELAPAMRTLRQNGIRFFFSEKRSGWYLNER